MERPSTSFNVKFRSDRFARLVRKVDAVATNTVSREVCRESLTSNGRCLVASLITSHEASDRAPDHRNGLQKTAGRANKNASHIKYLRLRCGSNSMHAK
jgi:hypothetical protein